MDDFVLLIVTLCWTDNPCFNFSRHAADLVVVNQFDFVGHYFMYTHKNERKKPNAENLNSSQSYKTYI